jgi:hypothetical protein
VQHQWQADERDAEKAVIEAITDTADNINRAHVRNATESGNHNSLGALLLVSTIELPFRPIPKLEAGA